MTSKTSGRDVLRNALKSCRAGFAGTLAFGFFINLLVFTAPLYMLQVYDRVLGSRSETTLFMLGVIVAALLVVMGYVDAMRGRLLARTGARLDAQLNAPVFRAILKRTLYGSASSQTQSLRDLDTLRDFFAGQAFVSLSDLPWVPVFIAAGFLFHPWIGLTFLAGALILLALALINELVTRRAFSEANRGAITANSLAEASVRNAEVIAAMGMHEALIGRWSQRHGKVLAKQALASERASGVLAATRFSRTLVQVAVLTVGAYLVIHQKTTPGIMIAASIIMARALAPVEQSVSHWRSLIGAQAAYKRLSELLGRYPEEAQKLSHPRPQGFVSVQNAYCTPAGSQRTSLRGVNFALEPGDVLGVVGASAAGKSSLARMLTGVWPTTAGEVRLDGVALGHWNRDELGRYIGYLPQDVELFEGTVVDNIARFGDVDDQRILAAAHKAGVHDLILTLPEGYETNIGDGGKALSGGQRQRVALARALYGDPPLMVLDEPNANLDARGEQLLAEAIIRMRDAGQTVVIITHRPALLSAVNKLLLLRDGKVEAFGTREEVVKRLGRTRAGDLLRGKAPSKIATLNPLVRGGEMPS